jgi:hypothetical protein
LIDGEPLDGQHGGHKALFGRQFGCGRTPFNEVVDEFGVSGDGCGGRRG